MKWLLKKVAERATVMVELLSAPKSEIAPPIPARLIHPHEQVRRQSMTVAATTDDLRERLKKLGWLMRELPIRTGGRDSAEVASYKLIAVKGDKSIILGGKTLHEAMSNMCKTLGALPK